MGGMTVQINLLFIVLPFLIVFHPKKYSDSGKPPNVKNGALHYSERALPNSEDAESFLHYTETAPVHRTRE